MDQYIRKFSQTGLLDVPVVGGKNASLGEMFSKLSDKGIKVPDGFATTAFAFRHFLRYNKKAVVLQELLLGLDKDGLTNLADIGRQARQLLLESTIPQDLADAIIASYKELSVGRDADVAVRSSATAEDLPGASFAGQHESYLHIRGEEALLDAVKKCYASLYTDRAIQYREQNGFEHGNVAISVGIQKMIRSDKACAGVGFTLEPESGHRGIIHLAGVWGLGENIVQGESTPDEFLVFKHSLTEGKRAIIQRRCGKKEKTLVYKEEAIGDGQPGVGGQTISRGTPGVGGQTVNFDTPADKRDRFVLDDLEVTRLAGWALAIEQHYGRPMDIEWAKDGDSGELYILQARPETVHSRKDPCLLTEYTLVSKGDCLAEGEAIGNHIVTGTARVLVSPAQAAAVRPGDVIVTDITSPDWDPVLKRAAAIVTDKGGRTSHASIVARELGVPAIVGTTYATERIQDGETITVSCCEGKTGHIYRGPAEWKEKKVDLSKTRLPAHTRVMLITGDPGKAFQLSFYPNSGVGLMRMEFIITHHVQVHPMALVQFDTLPAGPEKEQIALLTGMDPDKRQYFVRRLSEGIATIAAAFYPKEVILRTSDFKTNEYANLPGGAHFEPKEENPMLGFRGASRYYHPLYKEGFRLECEAIRTVRDDMGLTNVKVMIPFCRTVEEGKKVIAVMKENGLVQHVNGLEIYMMAEIPSNVLLADEFGQLFDGFSIGSNDLTQLTLGIDRDSTLVAGLFSEQDKATRKMIGAMIEGAKAAGVKIGLCGQVPSDFPDFARFLVEKGIDSISFNADALLKGIEQINLAERRTIEHIL